jgi:hypothetical protein
MTDFERICRALCMFDGHDPDMKVYPFPPAVGPNGKSVVFVGADPYPAWLEYANPAHIVIDTLLESLALKVECGVDPTAFDFLMDVRTDKEAIKVQAENDEPVPAPDWRYKYGLATPGIAAGLRPR